jgi:hypothetical protein
MMIRRLDRYWYVCMMRVIWQTHNIYIRWRKANHMPELEKEII